MAHPAPLNPPLSGFNYVTRTGSDSATAVNDAYGMRVKAQIPLKRFVVDLL